MSKPGANESLKQDFIKVILTKDQGRDKGNKKWMRIGKSRCIELDRTRCCTEKFNTVLGVILFFREFLRSSCWRISSCWSTMALRSNHSLLLRIRVQLVVFYTTIKTQIVFKMLLILITGQLTIIGQLEREVYPWRIGLFLGSREQRWFWRGGLGRWGHQR